MDKKEREQLTTKLAIENLEEALYDLSVAIHAEAAILIDNVIKRLTKRQGIK